MICNNCGTENLDDMLYCKKCGAKTNLYYKINQKNLIESLVNFKHKDNMSLFTKVAYSVVTSRKKYINVFLLISAFVISIVFFTLSLSSLPAAFSKAVEVIYQGINDEYYIQTLWRDVWIRAIILILTLLLIIMLILIFLKIIKFIKIFKDDK